MLFPYKIIDSKLSTREQFEQVEGYQPTYALFYLKKGSFSIEIDGKKEKISEGDALLLPDYVYFKRSVIDPIEFIYVKFEQNLSCPYSFPIPFGKIEPKDKDRFLSNISLIERLSEREDSLSMGYLEHLLMDILFGVFYDIHQIGILSREYVSNDELVSSATEYIATHVNEKILIEDVCRVVGTNPSTLNFRFRRAFDLSVGEYILNERIRLAKRLLVGTTYSISEIADRCGFENVYYFSNVFKKQVGISPLKYRTGSI